MYISIITYSLLVLLLLWGGKLKVGRDKFHEDSTSLPVMKSLQGFAAICIIFHHISQMQLNAYTTPDTMKLFVNSGFYYVAIFFFCSGYGLIKSMEVKQDYLHGFFKKRVLRAVLVPFYVNILVYGLINIINHVKLEPMQWVTNLTGLTMMNTFAWYPIVLTVLYLVFFILFKTIKNRKLAITLMFVFIFLQGLFFVYQGHFAWWANEKKNWWMMGQPRKWWMEEKVLWYQGEWWVNSAITFPLGMAFAAGEEKIRAWFKKLYLLKTLCFGALWVGGIYLFGYVQKVTGGYWTENSFKGPGMKEKFYTFLSQIPMVAFFMIFLFAIMMRYHAENPITRFMGKIGYETYLMNLAVLNIFVFIIRDKFGRPLPNDYHFAIYVGVVLLGTILAGALQHLIDVLIQKKVIDKIGKKRK